MVLEISGYKKQVQEGLKYLRSRGVAIKSIAQEIRRNNEICIQCGACTAMCPTNALYIDEESREVKFAPSECKGCELCVAVCPVRAMEIRFAKDKVLA